MQQRLAMALADRYRIERELGAGGMATVYLAQDLKHDRAVAIKVLHEDLGATLGAERFLTEIKTTARLQHPHILQLLDSGEAQGLLYYVMPYVQGESLRDRLDREKQLPIDDAMRIAREVADALGFAHEHGIVHRDIKPENILLQGGHALVADFGIALAVQQAGGTRLTQTGLSLGTPNYMAPEQAMGEKAIDQRADVYALGAVTYEMLVGEPPFTGATVQAIVAKIMSERPVPLRTIRDTIPVHLESAVLRALAKLPADRFQRAHDFMTALTSSHSPAAASVPAAPRQHVRARWFAVALGLIVLAALAWFASSRMERAALESVPPSRLALPAPNLGGTGAGAVHRQVALTADGSALIYVSGDPSGTGNGGLAIQRLDEEVPNVIGGRTLLYAPSPSPDGKWVAVRIGTGEARRISMAGVFRDRAVLGRGFAFYAWHPDGSLWVTRDPFTSLERVRPDSDSLEVMFEQLEQRSWIQQILDDGRTAIVVENGAGAATGPCALLDLRTGKRSPLISTPIVSARYVAGLLVFVQPDGSLVAQPFDPKRALLFGTPVTIATGVSLSGTGDAQFEVARNGTVVYVPEEPRSLVLVNRDGLARPATLEHKSFHMPRFSPDGRRVSVDVSSAEGRDVWVLDLEQTTLTRVTFDRDGHDASWSHDGKSLTYNSSRTGTYGVYRIRPGSGNPADSLIASNTLSFPGQWLPDGSAFVAVATNLRPGSAQDIALVSNSGRGPIEPLLTGVYRESYPALSTDGKWLAFVTDQSGTPEVYVRSLVGGEQVQISQGGGAEPIWSRDGREIFYRSYDQLEQKLMVATVSINSGTIRITGRHTLFSLDEYLPTQPHANYDISPDGKDFAFVRRNPASRIVVIQNLPALVARMSGSAAR